MRKLVCQVYGKALSEKNLTSGFKKTGIWPCFFEALPKEKITRLPVYHHSSCSPACLHHCRLSLPICLLDRRLLRDHSHCLWGVWCNRVSDSYTSPDPDLSLSPCASTKHYFTVISSLTCTCSVQYLPHKAHHYEEYNRARSSVCIIRQQRGTHTGKTAEGTC